MAGPGGKEVGRVNIRVLPDTSKFGPSLQKYLERTEQRLELELPVSLNQLSVAVVEAELDALTRRREIDVDVNTETLTRGVAAATSGGIRGFSRMGAIIAAVTVAVGALAVALPAMLASIAAPIGAIALGFEGIKKAAEALIEPFAQLRDVVSQTFADTLTPHMERAAKLFPALERGFSRVAEAVSGMFGEIVDSLGFASAVGRLDAIFNNIALALDRLAPAVGPFVDSLLLLTEAGTKAFADFAPVLADLTIRFNEFLAMAQSTGLLANAMSALGATFALVAGTIAFVVGATIALFGALGLAASAISKLPGTIASAWKSVRSTTSSAWGAVQSTVSGAVSAVRSAVSSAWSRVRSITSSAWSAVQSTISRAVSGISSVIRKIPSNVRSGLSSLGSIGRNAAEAFKSGILGVLDSVVSTVQDKIDKIIGKFKEALRLGSPSRVMMQIGEWTGEGFALGMERALAGVENIANRMAMAPVEASATTQLLAGDFFSPDATSSGPIRVWVDNAREVADGVQRVAESVVSEEKSFASTMGRMG